MLNRIVVATVVASCAAFTLASVGAQSSYRLTVSPDETTRGDLDVVATALENAAIGSEVPRSLRRLASGAAGEMALLVNQRFSNGRLQLDDGSFVTLSNDDELQVTVSGETQLEYVSVDGLAKKAAKKTVIIEPTCTTGAGCAKPSYVLVIAGGKCHALVLFDGRPQVRQC